MGGMDISPIVLFLLGDSDPAHHRLLHLTPTYPDDRSASLHPARPRRARCRWPPCFTQKAGETASTASRPCRTGAPVLKARVRTTPEDGKANAALEKLIAKALRVPKSAVASRRAAQDAQQDRRIEADTTADGVCIGTLGDLLTGRPHHGQRAADSQ